MIVSAKCQKLTQKRESAGHSLRACENSHKKLWHEHALAQLCAALSFQTIYSCSTADVSRSRLAIVRFIWVRSFGNQLRHADGVFWFASLPQQINFYSCESPMRHAVMWLLIRYDNELTFPLSLFSLSHTQKYMWIHLPAHLHLFFMRPE
jgi:hypothetical protein